MDYKNYESYHEFGRKYKYTFFFLSTGCCKNNRNPEQKLFKLYHNIKKINQYLLFSKYWFFYLKNIKGDRNE